MRTFNYFQNGIKLASVAVLLSLAGCSHHQVPEESTTSPAAGTTTGAESYGANMGENYQGGKQSSDGRYVNPLTAPSNQVYYFDYDSNNVNSADYKALSIQANYLASHPNAKVRLEGSTDARGSREYNIGLGWRRDQTVARLLEQQGVQPNQIEMVSYGKEHPVALGNNEDAWRLNRRVELKYKAQ
jgi:peptidoglycan-associated lipoprotein